MVISQSRICFQEVIMETQGHLVRRQGPAGVPALALQLRRTGLRTLTTFTSSPPTHPPPPRTGGGGGPAPCGWPQTRRCWGRAGGAAAGPASAAAGCRATPARSPRWRRCPVIAGVSISQGQTSQECEARARGITQQPLQPRRAHSSKQQQRPNAASQSAVLFSGRAPCGSASRCMCRGRTGPAGSTSHSSMDQQ